MGVRDHRGRGVGAGAPADPDALPSPDVLQALVDFLADVVEEPTPPGVSDGPVDHDQGRDGRDGRDDRDGLEGRGALEARDR